jgi:hypothetical protein
MTITTIRKPEPTTVESSSAFAHFVLQQIGCAKLRAQITINQIEAAAAALSAGMISPEAALLILHEIGLSLVEASS